MLFRSRRCLFASHGRVPFTPEMSLVSPPDMTHRARFGSRTPRCRSGALRAVLGLPVGLRIGLLIAAVLAGLVRFAHADVGGPQDVESLPPLTFPDDGFYSDGRDIQALLPTRSSGPVVLDDGCAPGGSCVDGCPSGDGYPECFDDLWAPRPWSWQLLPNNLIYTSYLAGPKEPRIEIGRAHV